MSQELKFASENEAIQYLSNVTGKTIKISSGLSENQKEYQQFFKNKLEKYGVEDPGEMDEETRKKFFEEIDKEWIAEEESGKRIIKDYLNAR